MAIYVFGGANLDIYAKVKNDSVILYDSNPSDISFSFGGVGRNILDNIANLEAKPYFVSVFSSDPYGREMYEALNNKGVHLQYSKIVDNRPTASYIAVLNSKDMYVACSDTSILDEMDYNQLSLLVNVIKDDDYLIFDANLNEEIIDYICNNLKGIKVFDAISTSKVMKINNLLDRIDIVKLNRLEAEALSGIKIENEADIKEAARILMHRGLKKFLISSGNTVYSIDEHKALSYSHHAQRENPVNVTGAGDALLGNYIFALSQNKSEDEAVAFGLSAAILTVDDINAVRKMNRKLIEDNISFLKITKGELLL
ncbi:MAG: carbohydrate kinase family protein [Erysipelotrichaceae bacterium]